MNNYRLEITLAGLPSTPNARRHWRVVAKENKAWGLAVSLAVGNSKPITPLQLARLTLTRVSTTEPDYDNNVSSFKCIVDGLRYAKVLADDKKKNIGESRYQWEKCKKNQCCVRILVEGLD